MKQTSKKVRIAMAAGLVAVLSLTSGCWFFPDNGDDTQLQFDQE